MLNFYWDEYDFFWYLKTGQWPDEIPGHESTIRNIPEPLNEVRRMRINVKGLFTLNVGVCGFLLIFAAKCKR